MTVRGGRRRAFQGRARRFSRDPAAWARARPPFTPRAVRVAGPDPPMFVSPARRRLPGFGPNLWRPALRVTMSSRRALRHGPGSRALRGGLAPCGYPLMSCRTRVPVPSPFSSSVPSPRAVLNSPDPPVTANTLWGGGAFTKENVIVPRFSSCTTPLQLERPVSSTRTQLPTSSPAPPRSQGAGHGRRSRPLLRNLAPRDRCSWGH